MPIGWHVFFATEPLAWVCRHLIGVPGGGAAIFRRMYAFFSEVGEKDVGQWLDHIIRGFQKKPSTICVQHGTAGLRLDKSDRVVCGPVRITITMASFP